MAEKRNPQTFDNLAPPVAVTNPDGPRGTAYPKHMHGKDGSYIHVADADAEADALEDGYSLTPLVNLDGSKFAKDVAAEKEAAKAKKAKKD